MTTPKSEVPELKLCPWCGYQPVRKIGAVGFMHIENGCALSGINFTPGKWNSRPREQSGGEENRPWYKRPVDKGEGECGYAVCHKPMEFIVELPPQESGRIFGVKVCKEHATMLMSQRDFSPSPQSKEMEEAWKGVKGNTVMDSWERLITHLPPEDRSRLRTTFMGLVDLLSRQSQKEGT